MRKHITSSTHLRPDPQPRPGGSAGIGPPPLHETRPPPPAAEGDLESVIEQLERLGREVSETLRQLRRHGRGAA